MKSLFSIVLFVLTSSYLQAQCPSLDFPLPATACKNAELSVPATIADAVSFSWDFCDGSIANTPVSTQALNTTGISNAYDLTAVEENGNHFMFAVDYGDGTNGSGEIWRYDFCPDISTTPAITDLGYFGVIQRPLGIGFWKENGINYGLVVTEGGQLFRLNFGNSVINSPSVTQITGLTGLNDHRHIKIISENNSILAIIAGGNTTNISILNFGSSVENQPTRTFITVPGASNIANLDLVIECSNRYILASGYGSGLHLVSFGNSFLNPTPSFSQPTGFSSGNMLGISVVKSAGEYYAVVSHQPLGIVRANFGSSITNPNPQREDLGVFNAVNFAIGHTIVKSKSNYYSAGINFNGRLSILEFPKDCDIEDDFFGNDTPAIDFNESGTYSVTLSATGSDGEVVTLTKSITISNDEAPPFVINEDGACIDSQVTFVGQQANGEAVTVLSWDFGDGTQGSGQSATHQYSSTGSYSVVLSATAINGCVNRFTKSVEIYNAPVASFTLPTGLLCTNNEFAFINTTPDNFDGNLTYQWLIDNQLTSTTRDMLAAFASEGSKDITLQTFIPGCSDVVTQNIANVIEGPLTNFSFSGQCEDEDITFINTSSGTVSGYTWDFDDGQNSTDTNPIHIYTTAEVYDVTLTATNVAGCNNTKTKSVPIYSRPQVNFFLSPPPFSCNGMPSQFNDLTPNPTDSNIALWSWNFGDAGSSQNTSALRNPQHTYTDAGNYDVSLLVSTNFSCSSTLQLPVTISQSPVADFNHSAPCEDVLVNFSDVSTGTIQSWDWMIGSTVYATQNPTHTFINSGNTSVTLTVIANNDCIGSVNKVIVVPAKLSPDFTVSRNCVDQQTLFTDITDATADPVSSYSWDFGGLGTASGSPANFTFSNTGNVNVTLTLTTQTGCEYPVSKLVNIISSPQASFTASPLAGAPPLAVQFTNTSVSATSYQWAFNDENNSTSTQTSPLFTYQSLGQYQAELTASNAQNCVHTFSRTIDVVNPVVDVALSGLELMELQNGSLKPAVTIFNRGNVPISNLGLLIDMSGPVIRERVGATIMPNTSYRHVLLFEFLDTGDINYFCIDAEVTDLTKDDNRVCLSLEQSFTTLPPYPNPSNGELQVNWIINEDGIVNLTLINSMGQEVRNLQINSIEGLNALTLDTRGLGSGVYFLQLKYQRFAKVYRIFISE